MALHPPRRLLFVCLGNICRSPSAEGLCRAALDAAGLADRIETDSAGTGDWHVGEPPDPRAIDACARRGVLIDDLRGRQVTSGDFHRFDRILAMDRSNHLALRRMAPSGARADLSMMLDFAGLGANAEVPDPYYGGEQGFDAMLDLLEAAIVGLIDAERRALEGL